MKVAIGAGVAYGAALVLAPGTVLRTVAGTAPGHGARTTARVLGVRQLAQALATAERPVPAVLALGMLVDLLHLTSMVGLATISPRHRRCALVDAMAAAGWGAAGACSVRLRNPRARRARRTGS